MKSLFVGCKYEDSSSDFGNGKRGDVPRRAQRRGDEELRRLRRRDRKGRAAGRCVSDGRRGIRMRIGR
ncbi:unnamed protein product [Sphagnum balticum]